MPQEEFPTNWHHTHLPHTVPDVKQFYKEFVDTELPSQFKPDNFVYGEPKSIEMPFWTTQDTRNSVIASLIPAGAAAAAFCAFAKDQKLSEWWSAVKKPDWAPKDVRIYSAVDFLTLSPLGYASYLVYKNGGGFDYNDTKVALGLYGVNIALALATIPIVKKKELGCLWKNTAVIHLTAAGAAFAFYKIDKKAGLLLIPYAAWTAFYAYLAYSIKKENDPVKNL